MTDSDQQQLYKNANSDSVAQNSAPVSIVINHTDLCWQVHILQSALLACSQQTQKQSIEIAGKAYANGRKLHIPGFY